VPYARDAGAARRAGAERLAAGSCRRARPRASGERLGTLAACNSLAVRSIARGRAGLHVYVLSSWSPARKADFYAYHRYLGLAAYIAGLVGGISGLMEAQEFDTLGLVFVVGQPYGLGTLLLAAKAFLSLLPGLAVTYAWVVLP